MEITNNRNKAQVFSPFGRKTRTFTEPATSTSDVTIGHGKTLPDLIRIYYNTNNISSFSARFPFLDRDNKERNYSAVNEDPFIFKGQGSIAEFKNEAIRLIGILVNRWKELGLPTKKDEDRNIEIIDSAEVWKALDPKHKAHDRIVHYKNDISFIIANFDIMKKACIVRGIIPGWWASSYSGKTAPDLDHFTSSLNAHLKAIRILESSPKFKQIRDATFADLGDPIDTNTGYPDFTAAMDKMNNPIGRLNTLDRYKGIGTGNYSVAKLFSEVDKKSSGSGCEGVPFLIAPLRRLQAGYKWLHVFKPSSFGLISSHDERGNNSIRIAWMSSYIYNLLLSPLQGQWKSVRKMMPGLFHDGEAKRNRLAKMRADNPWIAEADYSNYDRFIPINLFLKFTKGYLNGKPNTSYWFDLCHTLHHGLPLVWPDYVGTETGRGWTFYPDALGLLSGVKITSEEGTFVNSIINGQGFLDTGLGDEASLVKYLTQYLNKPVGTGTEYWQVMSDDTLIHDKDPNVVKSLGDAFSKNVVRAGLKGSLELGDRFLMRHMAGGRDTPVPARVWQNTLSNEEGVLDELKFLVGLAMRSDGLLGQKTFDPFGTGGEAMCSHTEIEFTNAVLESILKFLTTAAHPQRLAIDYVKSLLLAGERMILRSGEDKKGAKMASNEYGHINMSRRKFLEMLADREQKLMKLENDSVTKAGMNTLLYNLHKERNVPSAKMLLDLITYSTPSLKSALDVVSKKEHSFYLYAMDKLNIPLTM